MGRELEGGSRGRGYMYTYGLFILLVKAMVFPVVIYGCESWTIKKAECQRIDAFELLEKTLESPLDSKEIKPVLKDINSEYLLEGLC